MSVRVWIESRDGTEMYEGKDATVLKTERGAQLFVRLPDDLVMEMARSGREWVVIGQDSRRFSAGFRHITSDGLAVLELRSSLGIGSSAPPRAAASSAPPRGASSIPARASATPARGVSSVPTRSGIPAGVSSMPPHDRSVTPLATRSVTPMATRYSFTAPREESTGTTRTKSGTVPRSDSDVTPPDPLKRAGGDVPPRGTRR